MFQFSGQKQTSQPNCFFESLIKKKVVKSQKADVRGHKETFFSKMWFLTFIWGILMTFLSTVSLLASSIGWLMSQLANLMFFLLQLLIISTTLCPSELLLKLCTAEQRTYTNPACFQDSFSRKSEYAQKNGGERSVSSKYSTGCVPCTLLLVFEITEGNGKKKQKKKRAGCFVSFSLQ